MGDLQVRMNKPLHAQDSYNKALELNTKFYGHIHDDNARIFKSLAALSTSKNDYLVTLKNYNEALKILSHIHSTAHPETINTILEISKYHRLLGDTNAELISLLSFNAQMQQVQNYGRFQLVSSVEDMTFQQAHERLLKLLYERPDKNLEVFEVVQTTTRTKLANDLNFSFAAQDPDKGSVLNNLREKRAILKNLLFRLSLENAKDMNKITSLREEIKLIEANLSSSFPGYSELVNPQPLSLSDTQDLLGLNEGLFTFVSDEETEATYAFMVTKDDARAYKVDLSEAQIAEIVSTLRAGIDLSNSFGIGDLPNFDMNLSYHLYSSLFGPAEDMLNGVEHLLVVPTGPLESLPLNLLVTKKPDIDPAASVFDNYQAAAWLPKSYSLTRLPSVSSLRALRVFAAAGEAKEPFIGFGDPILNGDAGDLRGLELASVYRGTTADIDQVRNLPELPDTADELKRIAQYLRAPADKIYLRERATETVLKNTDLTNSRVVAFATHGLVGGEISGLAEPALVLSPPDEATEEDDGLLKASEVAQLKMNADIIMLSACNTASGDELGAEGLSGLARAFIYAGARSLLVSHWSVESTSAAELTTGMFDAMSADKSIGRSEALQMSMVDLMTDKERSYYSHPAFWAPFSLVGDGATLN
jgi:CHAT domain-containing protein